MRLALVVLVLIFAVSTCFFEFDSGPVHPDMDLSG